MTNILGLDMSLNETGYCILSRDKSIIEKGVIKSKKENRLEKMLDIRGAVDKLIMEHNVSAVFMEDYSYGSRNTKWTFSAGELGGLIKVYLYESEIEYELVSPSMWKKYICGKGNLKKEQVLLQVYKKFNIEFKNNNECDAFCIAMFGVDFLDYKDGKQFNKEHTECFKKFDKEDETDG